MTGFRVSRSRIRILCRRSCRAKDLGRVATLDISGLNWLGALNHFESAQLPERNQKCSSNGKTFSINLQFFSIPDWVSIPLISFNDKKKHLLVLKMSWMFSCLFGEDLAALEAAKEVAEQTQHAALAAAIDRELLAKWLKGTGWPNDLGRATQMIQCVYSTTITSNKVWNCCVFPVNVYWTLLNYIYIVFYFTILMMMYFQLLQSFMVKEDWNLRTLALAIQLDSKGNVTWPSRLVVFFGELPLFHIGDSCVFNI